jgi:hypothetical protein
MDELDRVLQDDWVERIPNRRYTRALPLVGSGTGTFGAELVEEMQPIPTSDQRRLDLTAAFSLPRFRWIAWLDVTGVSLIVLATAWLITFGARFHPASVEPRLFSLATLGLAMLALGHYCFRAGNSLWGRFDFTSRVVWVEMQGNYQSARMDFGNTFSDRVKTEKQIINIETMTLRVWAADLDSVIFGKHAKRYITGLSGVPGFAKQMVNHLSDFAHNQSIVVAPTSQVDLQKGAMLGALNQVGGAIPSAPLLPTMMKAVAAATTAVMPPAAAQSPAANCSGCYSPIEPSDRFCGACGAAI